MAAQEVRTINILADGETEKGIFTSLPENMTPNAFSNYLKENSKKFRGTAFLSFIDLIKKDPSFLKNEMNLFMDTFLQSYSGRDFNSQVMRVAQDMGFLAACGEIAIQNQIFPWNEGDAIKALTFCFNKWVQERKCDIDFEIEKSIEEFLYRARNNFFGQNGRDRGIIKFVSKNKEYFYVQREYIVPDICPAYRYRAFVDALNKEHFLLQDKNRLPQEQPDLGSAGGRRRGIAIEIAKLWQNGDESECNKDFSEEVITNSNIFG